MGDTLKFDNGIQLKVKQPVPAAEIRLIRNGELISKLDSNEAEFKIDERGAYRVEVYFFNEAWIYSNHIRIGI